MNKTVRTHVVLFLGGSVVAHYMHVQVSVPANSGLPRDAVTNSWSYIVPDGVAVATGVAAFNTMLENFYTDLGDSKSSQYDWDSVTAKHYDMSDAEPRVPVSLDVLDFGAPATTFNDMPAEVALVLSFRAAIVSGTNARRRRGRVYIGPFQRASGDIPSAGGLATDVSDAANDFILNPGAGGDSAVWAVYSRSTHFGKAVGEPIQENDNPNPAFLADAFQEVVQCWVDNAWDTQRRRGPVATGRTTHNKE